MRWFVLSFLLIAATTGAPLSAATDPATCDRAARVVSDATGAPYEALTELMPTAAAGDARSAPAWPWTVGRDGTAAPFETRDEALAFAYRTFTRDGPDFEIGCFQINFAAHRAQFASLDEMFDPLTGARYAARYLNLLHDEFGDWTAAVEAFRLRDRAAVTKHLTRLVGFRTAAAAPGGRPHGTGSLVPMDGMAGPRVALGTR